jgi:hypothetical protein
MVCHEKEKCLMRQNRQARLELCSKLLHKWDAM